MSKMGASPGLLDLPEEIICEILQLVDATTLYLLSRTCTRLEDIIRNNVCLWRCIDARRSPNDREKIAYCLDRCYDDGNTWTHTFLVRGDHDQTYLVPPGFLPRISTFTNLTILACEKLAINGKKYNAMIFPPYLEELSLRKTKVYSPLKFFKGSGQHFKNLRVLILDECDWLTSAALMSIAKCNNLEILSVYKCERIENCIAYLSMAGQGFKALKVFDARLSPLGSTLIRAIYRLRSLLAIYLQNNDISYKLDYYRRKLEIIEGSRPRDYHYEDYEVEEEEDGLRLNCEDNEVLDDNGLIDYLTVPSSSKETQFPRSVLYLDPYNVCTCGFEDSQKKKAEHGTLNGKDDDDDDDDDDDIENDAKRKIVQGKIAQIAHLLELSHSNNYSRGLPNTNNATSHTDTLRTFLQSEASTSMGNVHVCLNFSVGPDASKQIMFGFLNSEEPPTKRPRIEDPVPGPSGLYLHHSDSETEEECDPSRRPPTPHPDVTLNSPENIVYKIAFEDAPIVQIENIGDVNKNMELSLRRLSLRGYKKITNTTLRYIGDLDLDLLDLTYTSVTFEGIQKYLESHPLCRIVHERFCICLPNLHF